MEKYIKEFNNHSDYGASMNGNQTRPIVSWCTSENEVHFDKTPPLVDMYYSVYEEPSVAKGGDRDTVTYYSYCIYDNDLKKIGYASPVPGVVLVNGEFVEGVSDVVFSSFADEFFGKGYRINGISSELLDPLKDDVTVGIYNYVDPPEPPIPLRGATSYIPHHDKCTRVYIALKEYVEEIK